MNEKMKILAIFVIYNPDISLLHRNIGAVYEYVDSIIVWDNSSETNFAPAFLNKEKVKYINKGINLGLSKAYNYAWKYAKENEFSHLLTMDQDSTFEDFGLYLSDIKKANEVAIFVPYVEHIVFKKLKSDIQEVDTAINSGALIPIEILKATNGYYEDFLLDMVDEEFFQHARALGYKILKLKNHRLIHCFGNSKEIRLFHKHICWNVGYSPKRIYGICRNRMIVFHKYHLPKKDMFIYIFRDFKNFVKMFLFESNKLIKSKAYLYGYFDGIFNKSSRIYKFDEK